MRIFKSEEDLVDKLDEHDRLVFDCALGRMEFKEFCDRYDNFYFVYSLDGHESDTEERMLIDKYSNRIDVHRLVAYEVLQNLCDEQYAVQKPYIDAGRFGAEVALKRLKDLVNVLCVPKA